MSTGEGGARDDGKREDRDHRGDRIGIGGGDDSVTKIQLAARWAESFGSGDDSLGSVLKRFRAAFEYLDSVIHGVEPTDLDRALETRAAPQPVASAPTPAYSSPAESTAPPSPQPQAEPRPWA